MDNDFRPYQIRRAHEALEDLPSNKKRLIQFVMPPLPPQRSLEELEEEVNRVAGQVYSTGWNSEENGSLFRWLEELAIQIHGLQDTEEELAIQIHGLQDTEEEEMYFEAW